MTIDELQVLITANTDDLRKEINKTNALVNGLSKNAKKSTGSTLLSFKNLAKGITALGIGKIIKDSIQSGMDAVESESLFEVSLDKYADDVRDWSNTMADALGLNAVELRKNTGTIYNMTTSMGVAEKNALTLSKGVTMLTNDMASFYNLDTETAFTKLRAGLSGETEPLKQLGILVDDNTIKQVAYASGIAKTGETLTAEQKVLARYTAILNQTKNAQGDLARTMDSPANMFRRLSTEIKNCSQSLGALFMPVVQTVLPYIIALAKCINTALKGLGSLVGGKKNNNIADTMSTAGVGAEAVADGMEDANKSAKAMSKSLAGFDEIDNLAEKSSGGTNTGAGVGGGLDFTLDEYDAGIDGLQDKTASIVQAITDEFNKLDFTNLLDSLSKLGDALKPLGANIGAGLKWLYDKVLLPMAQWTVSTFLPSFLNMVADAINFLNEVIEYFKPAWSFLWDNVLSPLFSLTGDYIVMVFDNIGLTLQTLTGYLAENKDGWANYWAELGKSKGVEAFKNSITNLGTAFKSTMDNIRATMEPVINKLGDMFTNLWEKHIAPIVPAIVDLFTQINDLFSGVVLPIVQQVYTKIQPALMFIVDILGTVLGAVADVVTGAINFISGIIEFITGAFTGDWDKAWEGIKKSFGGIWDAIMGVLKGAVNIMIGILNALLGGIEKAVNRIIDMINTLHWEIPDWVPAIGGKTFGFNFPNVKFNSIPLLARGGIVDSPTLAMIGEAGKEAVVPLENNTEWLDKLASKVVVMSRAMNEGGDNYTINNSIDIDGKVVAKQILKDLNKEAIRQGYKPLLSY